MPHGVEADRAQPQGVFDGADDHFEGKGLQQSQNLDVLPPQRRRPVTGGPGLPPQRRRPVTGGPVLPPQRRRPVTGGPVLAAACLAESRFEQSPQCEEAVRQLPAYQRGGLVKGSCLLFNKCKVVQWIEDHRFVLITASMYCNHITAAGDHHLVYVALHMNLTVPVLGRHGVVVGAITDQRQRTDPHLDLLAGFVRRRGQRQHRCPVTLEALADRLHVSAEPPLTALAALCCKMRVQLIPAIYTWNRNHEVPPRITDDPFYLTLVVTLGGTPELIGE